MTNFFNAKIISVSDLSSFSEQIAIDHSIKGPFMGGPQCCMSVLRNGNVACPCRLLSPMSHVEFKKRRCPMSLKSLAPVARHYRPYMSHVEFLKCPCRPVDFRGLGP